MVFADDFISDKDAEESDTAIIIIILYNFLLI